MTWKQWPATWSASVDQRESYKRPEWKDSEWKDKKSQWNKGDASEQSKWKDSEWKDKQSQWSKGDASGQSQWKDSEWIDKQSQWSKGDASGQSEWKKDDSHAQSEWKKDDSYAQSEWKKDDLQSEWKKGDSYEQSEWKKDGSGGVCKSYYDWSMRNGSCFLFGALDWATVLPSLPAFEKDFYIPHPSVEKRSDVEVAAILRENKIQIIPSQHVPVVIVERAERPAVEERTEDESYVYSSSWKQEEDGTWINSDQTGEQADNTDEKVETVKTEETIGPVETVDNTEETVEPVDTVETFDNTDEKVETVETEETVDRVETDEIEQVKVDRPVPKPVTSLLEASFPEYITAKLFQMLGDLTPTAVQMLMWPVALSGRDCLAVAPTGTGKTLGYLLPAIVHISAQPPVLAGENSPIVLVIAPTRELTAQIMEQAVMYGSAITEFGAQTLTPMALFGGVPKIDHKEQLEAKSPDFIVATPGRLMDFMKDGVICLRRVTYLVIDEVDRFLREDKRSFNWKNLFADDIREIASQIRPDRQCVMCSATCDTSVMSLARDLCAQEPVYFQVAEQNQERKLVVSSNVQQDFIDAGSNYHERVNYLLAEILPATFTETLSRSEQKMIIFVNSKNLVDQLTMSLRQAGWPAIGVSGDKLQEEREWIFASFKSGANNILVATDVMGRGMDFENVRCVLNFDLPDEIEDYIHRVGRTGRIGKKIRRGFALSFVTTRDWNIMRGLGKMFEDCNLEVPELLKDKIEQVYKYEHRQ